MRRISIITLAGLGMLTAGCDLSPSPNSVPVAHNGPSMPSCPATIVVQQGDNVYSVSRRCGLSVRELIDANGLQPPYALIPGTTLRMPGATAEIVVGKGDTLRGLAHKLHVDFNAFAAANHKIPPYTIRLGEHLRLPGSAASPSPKETLVEQQPLPPPPKPKVGTDTGLPAQALPPPVAGAKAPPSAPPAPQSVSPPAPPAAAVAAVPPPAAPIPAQAPPPAALPSAIKGFIWPVKGEVLIAFGPQAAKGQNNDGINISAPKGTPILAAETGVVAYVGNELKGFGNLVLIKHADGWVSAYAHADQVEVKKGQAIAKGQQIGTVGQTGSVTQSQLHFELRHQGEAVDPEEYLPG